MAGLLNGQVALVTGAARRSGIGFATARLFAAEGARVAVLDLEDQNPASAAREIGPRHAGYSCDIRDEEACREAVRKTEFELGPIAALVSNAGVVQPRQVLEITRADYDFVMDVNLRGAFNIVQPVLAGMAARRNGSIVCVSSITGQRGGIFGGAHYAASKAGILGFVKTLARQYGRDNIRANVICPGVIVTGFTSGPKAEADNAKAREECPLGRLGTGEDVAKAALFLASDLAAYITGAVLDVNGGLHIH